MLDSGDKMKVDHLETVIPGIYKVRGFMYVCGDISSSYDWGEWWPTG